MPGANPSIAPSRTVSSRDWSPIPVPSNGRAPLAHPRRTSAGHRYRRRRHHPHPDGHPSLRLAAHALQGPRLRPPGARGRRWRGPGLRLRPARRHRGCPLEEVESVVDIVRTTAEADIAAVFKESRTTPTSGRSRCARTPAPTAPRASTSPASPPPSAAAVTAMRRATPRPAPRTSSWPPCSPNSADPHDDPCRRACPVAMSRFADSEDRHCVSCRGGVAWTCRVGNVAGIGDERPTIASGVHCRGARRAATLLPMVLDSGGRKADAEIVTKAKLIVTCPVRHVRMY